MRAPTGWALRSADSLASFYLSNTSSIYKALLEESDSLFLSASQISALRRADSVYSARVRSVYVPLGEFLARSRGSVGKTELDSAQATQKAYWKIFWEQPEIADSIITATQKELFPMLRGMVSTPKKDREHSQWQFGFPVRFSYADPDKTPKGGNRGRGRPHRYGASRRSRPATCRPWVAV